MRLLLADGQLLWRRCLAPCNSREALLVTGGVLHLSGALQVLKDVAEAKVRDLDMWQISLACSVEQQKAEDLPDGKLTQPQQVRIRVQHSRSMQIGTDVIAGSGGWGEPSGRAACWAVW